MSSLARRIQIRAFRKAGIKQVPSLRTTTGSPVGTRWPILPTQVAFIDGKPFGRDDQHPVWQPVLDILAGKLPAAE